ncbi:MAG: hypothetical protein KVP17_004735, partial [Porospora cf. gigantea B]|uniref:uncharacterized protein n=2 Tax=Porospora cf. gigantea B TaxID=2853592 RepID=UPI0035718D7D
KREDGGYTPSNSTDMKMESSTPTSIKYDAKSGLQEMPVKETPIDHRSSGELDSSYQTLDSGDLHQGMKTPPNEDSMPLMTPDPNSPHAQIIQSLLRSPSFLSMSPISQLHMALLHGGDYLPDSDISRLLRASTDDPEICALTPAEVRQAFQVKRSRGRPPNSVAAFHRLVNLLREARERRPRGRPSSRDKQQHPLLPFLPKEILPPNYVAQFPPASRVAPPPYVRAKSSGRRSKNSQIYPSRWHTYWQISLSDNEDEVEVKQEDSPKDSEIARIVTKREDGVIIKEVELHVPLCRLCGFDAFHVGAGPVLPWYSPLGGPGAFGGFGGKKAYVHIRCALGLHGVLDVNSKGIRLPKPDQERLSMSCLKCRRKGLYPVQCAHPDCYVALHVGCATASPDCRTEWRIEGPQVFCPRHSEMDAPTPQLKVYLQNKKLKMPGMLVSSIWPPSSTTDPVVQGNPQLALLYCIANQCLVGPSAASLLMNRTDNKKDIRAVEPIAFRGWSSATITSFAPDTPLAQRQRVIERIQRLLVYPEGLARIAEWAVQDGTRIGIQRVLRESEARLFDEKPPPNSNRFVAYAWEVMIQLWLLSGGQAADDLPLMLLALAKYGGFLPNSAPVPSLPPWSSIVTHCFGCGIPGVCFDTQKRGLVTDVSVLLVLPCSVCNITLCRNCVEAWEGPEAASVWDSCCEAQTFLCGRCRFSSFANCVLCPRRDGWLIPIDDDEWIHPQCYDCVVPVKSRQSAPTILAATQKAENVGTMCSICGLSVGATVKCGFPDCPVRFHYTCAALMGSRCDEKDSYQCLLHSALLNPEHHQMDHLVSSPLDDLLQLEGGRWSLGGISTLIKFDMSYRLKEVGKNPVDLAVAFIEGLGLKLQPPLHWSVREPEDELAEELANMHL